MDLKEDIKNRLASFGYTLLDTDNWMLDFAIDKVENYIKNTCSITEIPDGLYQVEIDRVCGEFLFSLKSTGNLEGFNFEASIKEIKDLDTTVIYAVGSDSSEKQFDTLVDSLKNCGEKEILSFRRLRW